MPRTSGVFSLVPSYKATSGQNIRTEQHNPPLEDIATAITGSLPRDGSAPMTANLPMNGQRITNLGAATQDSDAVRRDQVTLYSAYLSSVAAVPLEANRLVYATGSGTAAATPFTAFMRTLLDDADAPTARGTLGLSDGATAAKATQAEGEAGTNDAKFMTPLKTKQAIAEQVDVSGEMALAAALSVGSYALLRVVNGGPFSHGNITTGGNLSPCDLNGVPNSSGGAVVTISGQWRCMGRTTDAGVISTGPSPTRATLWLRIS